MAGMCEGKGVLGELHSVFSSSALPSSTVAVAPSLFVALSAVAVLAAALVSHHSAHDWRISLSPLPHTDKMQLQLPLSL